MKDRTNLLNEFCFLNEKCLNLMKNLKKRKTNTLCCLFFKIYKMFLKQYKLQKIKYSIKHINTQSISKTLLYLFSTNEEIIEPVIYHLITEKCLLKRKALYTVLLQKNNLVKKCFDIIQKNILQKNQRQILIVKTASNVLNMHYIGIINHL